MVALICICYFFIKFNSKSNVKTSCHKKAF